MLAAILTRARGRVPVEEVETLDVLLEEDVVWVGVGGKSNRRITSGDAGRWRESRCRGGGGGTHTWR